MKQSKFIFSFAFCIIAFISSLAFAGEKLDCNKSDLTQLDMNFCAHTDYVAADRILNKIWPKVMAWAKERDLDIAQDQPHSAQTLQNLLKAQRAWVDYRDGHCATKSALFTNDTIGPMIVNACLENLTKIRAAQLIALMKEE